MYLQNHHFQNTPSKKNFDHIFGFLQKLHYNMDNQHILKQGEESISSKKQNLKRKDPRENGENGSENSSDAENYSSKMHFQ